jgi:hypothetical protein
VSAPIDDPLVTRQQPERPLYATGLMLGPDDFTAEQSYHRARLARVLAYLHGSGTVSGLEVLWEAAQSSGGSVTKEETLRVKPGLAVDRIGRLVEVPADQCVRLDRWYQQQPAATLAAALKPVAGGGSGITVDVFLRFAACGARLAPAMATGPFDALDAVSPTRVNDQFELTLVVRLEDKPPVPASPWPDLTGVAADQRPDKIRRALFDSWQEATRWTDQDALKPAPEQPATGVDPTAVLLARLVLPATAAATAGGRPVRTAGAAVKPANEVRLFVLPTSAIAHLAGGLL